MERGDKGPFPHGTEAMHGGKSYRSLGRRIRRRYPRDEILVRLITLPFLLLGAGQYLCIVAWFLPSWHGTALAVWGRWLWCASNIFTCLMMGGGLFAIRWIIHSPLV